MTIDTPEGAAAMKTFLTLKGRLAAGRRELQRQRSGPALAAGTAASAINWPNWVATFEDPAQSKMVGKIAYTPIPAGTKAGSSEIGHWTMGIMAAPRTSRRRSTS